MVDINGRCLLSPLMKWIIPIEERGLRAKIAQICAVLKPTIHLISEVYIVSEPLSFFRIVVGFWQGKRVAYIFSLLLVPGYF